MRKVETLPGFPNMLDDYKSCKLDELFNFKPLSHSA